MGFSDAVTAQAWSRSAGLCECQRISRNHGSRFMQTLSRFARGTETPTGWEAHHITAVAAGGEDTLENCELLCQACHKATGSYGGI